MGEWQIVTGDCLEVMPTLEADSVDTILTDPPYGLSFMGKDWDHGVPGVHFWTEALRVAKPGAILMAFGGTRTFHRLAVAIEDAGWEIRDTVMWVYGSGFPKSHDISKAIDRAAGAFQSINSGNYRSNAGLSALQGGIVQQGAGPAQWAKGSNGLSKDNHTPATPAAQEWNGYGTALKPAWEPVIVAMKPLDGTFAENAQRWGVAGLWIDGGRIATDELAGKVYNNSGANLTWGGTYGRGTVNGSSSGRWPANVIHDGSDEVLAGFPVADTGSTARFFYCAKASRAERNAGLEGMEAREKKTLNDYTHPSEGRTAPKNGTPQSNFHPTVKPLALMRYLARLTKTPTGGVILDPFAGSGSTGCAAVMEGRRFIGIEIDPTYSEIARQRIEKAQEQARQLELIPR